MLYWASTYSGSDVHDFVDVLPSMTAIMVIHFLPFNNQYQVHALNSAWHYDHYLHQQYQPDLKQNASDFELLLIGLAKNQSQDRASTTTSEYTTTENCIMPTTTKHMADIIVQKFIDPKLNTIQQPVWRITMNCRTGRSNYHSGGEKDYMSHWADWLSIKVNCRRILNDEIKMLAHNKGMIWNKAIPLFEQWVNKDSMLAINIHLQITVNSWTMCNTTDLFDTQYGISIYNALSYTK